jgi:hypothetical protein
MQKSLSFYKPNSYNKGSAGQFQYGAKDGDFGLYVSIVKQAAWNTDTKRGSFSENAKNPSKNKKIKLNATEAAAMSRVILCDVEKWSSVHRSESKTTSIMFSHYIKDNTKLGYGFSISEKDGESFMLSLNNDEGYVLKNFLEEYIKFTFNKQQLNTQQEKF